MTGYTEEDVERIASVLEERMSAAAPHYVYVDTARAVLSALVEDGKLLQPGVAIVEDVTDGELLRRMGTDARKWAQEFTRRFAQVDEGLMLGWFASAIETGRTAGEAGVMAKLGLEPRESVGVSQTGTEG